MIKCCVLFKHSALQPHHLRFRFFLFCTAAWWAVSDRPRTRGHRANSDGVLCHSQVKCCLVLIMGLRLVAAWTRATKERGTTDRQARGRSPREGILYCRHLPGPASTLRMLCGALRCAALCACSCVFMHDCSQMGANHPRGLPRRCTQRVTPGAALSLCPCVLMHDCLLVDTSHVQGALQLRPVELWKDMWFATSVHSCTVPASQLVRSSIRLSAIKEECSESRPSIVTSCVPDLTLDLLTS
jgi:hypothetical protein